VRRLVWPVSTTSRTGNQDPGPTPEGLECHRPSRRSWGGSTSFDSASGCRGNQSATVHIFWDIFNSPSPLRPHASTRSGHLLIPSSSGLLRPPRRFARRLLSFRLDRGVPRHPPRTDSMLRPAGACSCSVPSPGCTAVSTTALHSPVAGASLAGCRLLLKWHPCLWPPLSRQVSHLAPSPWLRFRPQPLHRRRLLVCVQLLHRPQRPGPACL
jgi:hypothetical protein